MKNTATAAQASDPARAAWAAALTRFDGDLRARGAAEGGGAGLVGPRGDDLRLVTVHPIQQRLQVRALAGGEHTDGHRPRGGGAGTIAVIHDSGHATCSFGNFPPVERSVPAASSASTRASTAFALKWR
jgi:hypothetical protein